ncbi:MAG: hypothetical protein R2879_04020 [Saprospiraceae bacterium]
MNSSVGVTSTHGFDKSTGEVNAFHSFIRLNHILLDDFRLLIIDNNRLTGEIDLSPDSKTLVVLLPSPPETEE